VSGAQFGFTVLRHKWNPSAPEPQVGKDVLIFGVVTVIVYMVIYALEWSWNYVVLAPMIMDGENQKELKEQADVLASLSQGQNEIKVRVANLMERYEEIFERLERVQNDAEFAELVTESEKWIRDTIAALKDGGEPADAVAFSQVGKVPPSAADVHRFRHILDETRRAHLIRLTMYRESLRQIMSNRRWCS
jgi:hypothetical protein